MHSLQGAPSFVDNDDEFRRNRLRKELRPANRRSPRPHPPLGQGRPRFPVFPAPGHLGARPDRGPVCRGDGYRAEQGVGILPEHLSDWSPGPRRRFWTFGSSPSSAGTTSTASLPFLALCALLSVSLAACTSTRQAPALRVAQSWRFAKSESGVYVHARGARRQGAFASASVLPRPGRGTWGGSWPAKGYQVFVCDNDGGDEDGKGKEKEEVELLLLFFLLLLPRALSTSTSSSPSPLLLPPPRSPCTPSRASPGKSAPSSSTPRCC